MPTYIFQFLFWLLFSFQFSLLFTFFSNFLNFFFQFFSILFLFPGGYILVFFDFFLILWQILCLNCGVKTWCVLAYDLGIKIQTAVKPNYFNKQCSSSSFLLTWSRYTVPKWPFVTELAIFMSKIYSTSLLSTS